MDTVDIAAAVRRVHRFVTGQDLAREVAAPSLSAQHDAENERWIERFRGSG